MEETKVMEAQLYQWILTDKAGDYSYEDRIEEKGDDTFMIFTDGSRVNVKMIGEAVIKVEDEEDGYIIVEEKIEDVTIAKGADGKDYEVPGIDHGKIIKKRIPKPANKKKTTTPPPSQVTEEKVSKPVTDPVIILLEKAKKERQTYEIDLNVDVISSSLFNVVKSSFEDGEDKALEYIVSLIDMEMLKDQLKEKLKEVYNE